MSHIESPGEYDALWDVIVKDLATSIAHARYLYRLGHAAAYSPAAAMSTPEDVEPGGGAAKKEKDPSDQTGQVATSGNKVHQRRLLKRQAKKRDAFARVARSFLEEIEKLGDETIEADREEAEGPDLFPPDTDLSISDPNDPRFEEARQAQKRRARRRET